MKRVDHPSVMVGHLRRFGGSETPCKWGTWDGICKCWYNPYEQLWGYVATGNESYITRQGNAREIIKEIDIELIKNYLKYLKEKANARH